MKSDVKNIIELTKLDNSLDVAKLTPESASGEFTKYLEPMEFPEEEKYVINTIKPLPTYEMDHLRNSLIPIFNDKSNAILDELSRTVPIEFSVGIFKITITKGVF